MLFLSTQFSFIILLLGFFNLSYYGNQLDCEQKRIIGKIYQLKSLKILKVQFQDLL